MKPCTYVHAVRNIELANLLTDLCGLGSGLQNKLKQRQGPDHLWPDIWSGMSLAARRMEKQQWTIEKTEARRAKVERQSISLFGDDKEFKETIKKRMEKFRTFSKEAAMPCKLKTFPDGKIPTPN